jgi:hypothetical protein
LGAGKISFELLAPVTGKHVRSEPGYYGFMELKKLVTSAAAVAWSGWRIVSKLSQLWRFAALESWLFFVETPVDKNSGA